MTTFLTALAVALSHLLGFARPLPVPRMVLPVAVPLVSGTPAWMPPLGLPGDYTPMTGGEP